MSKEISDTLGLTPLPPSQPDVIELENLDSDYEFARGNLIRVIEKGNLALDGILNVADMSQHPRGYEVVATLIKTMADANKDLLELSKRKKDLSGNTNSPKTINNNLFVGSTAELQKLLKDANGGN